MLLNQVRRKIICTILYLWESPAIEPVTSDLTRVYKPEALDLPLDKKKLEPSWGQNMVTQSGEKVSLSFSGNQIKPVIYFLY